MNKAPFLINEHGDWYYKESKITRHAMVKLFSTILVRDDDNTFHLRTPVEDVLVEVTDAPFIIKEMFVKSEGNLKYLCFKTNVDTILVPKAGTASDVYMVDCLLTQIETNKKLKNKIGIECLIETALGMSNIKEIATSSERLEALHFGVADYAASLRARTTVIGGLNPNYPGDQWHHGLSELVMTCRAYGLRPIDGPFGDFNDPDSYTDAAKRGAAIGIEGKWAIHPSQIELANNVFSPPEAEVTKAKRILEELEKAAKEGKGAAQLDGRMIDAASAKMAENIVNIDKLIHNK